jgi:hypothetical protein
MWRNQSVWRSVSVFVRTGRSQAKSGASCARVALLLSCSAVMLGGCSSAPAPRANSGLVSAFVAQPPMRPLWPSVEVEDDGLEAQRPPRQRMFTREDDPTQPFSPNYGEVPLQPAAEEYGDISDDFGAGGPA